MQLAKTLLLQGTKSCIYTPGMHSRDNLGLSSMKGPLLAAMPTHLYSDWVPMHLLQFDVSQVCS
jgi:hypothetical protein